MLSVLDLVICCLLVLQQLVAASPVPQKHIPRYFQSKPVTRRSLTTDTVERELGPGLSEGTLIFGPRNPLYNEVTERWAAFVRPHVKVVVQPSEESDIAKIVKYCHENSIDFLVRTRGHGVDQTMSDFKGMQISMEQLQGIEINQAGETVWLQGGSYAGPTIAKLWDEGYVTSTGAAECVGLNGLGLGGGHGRLESLYGLVADGYVHLNVVLSDGSEIGVNDTSHRELFWAMKGAGHNFGIVTSSRVKIHKKPTNTWHFHSYVWKGDKLEQVFEEINKLHKVNNGTTDPLMAFEAGLMTMNTSISETEPILYWGFVYNGPGEHAEKLLKPFNAIEAEYEEVDDIPYDQVAERTGSGEGSPLCEPAPYILSNSLLREYNIKAQRRLYDLFVDKLTEYPELAATAGLSHEGYANNAVKAIPYDSTAYAHRAENCKVFFRTVVPDGSDLYEPSVQWAKEAFDIWNEGQVPKTYINYVSGHPWETLESTYGTERWRLERLRKLKSEYDPRNAFRYYVPIEAE